MAAQPSAPPLSPSSPQTPLSGHMQQIGEDLQCSICIEYFTDPISLQCQHNFCRGCIGGAVRPRPGGQEIECPLCRKKTLLVGSAETCVRDLPRNFVIAGIVDKFQAAERERQRANEELEQRQALEQIEQSRRREREEQENHQRLQQVEQQHRENPTQNQQQPTPSDYGGQMTPTRANASSARRAGIRRCNKCPSPAVICCVDCNEDFCLECQQTHHGNSIIGKDESHSEEKAASEHPPSLSQETEDQPHVDREQEERLQQLLLKQQHLEREVGQQQALANFTPAPHLQRQQSDRWDELQEKQGTRRQVSEEYPPQHQHEDLPQEPLSWPLSRHQQNQQVYHPQDLSLYQPHGLAYPSPYPEPQMQSSPPPSMAPSSQVTCSHCSFPAATHCQQCNTDLCWQCKGNHDVKGGTYALHNIVKLMDMASLSGPCTLGPEQDVTNCSLPRTLPMIQMMPAEIVAPPVIQDTVTYSVPYTCDIKDMGPGKTITVTGQPNGQRFHINLMCSKNLKSGDIALHFNPRFSWPKKVVRNTRIGGKYGSEECGGPSFPFKAEQPFKIEVTCLLDKFTVNVDNKPFIMYKHRIIDLSSIKYLNVNGQVQITSVNGCT